MIPLASIAGLAKGLPWKAIGVSAIVIIAGVGGCRYGTSTTDAKWQRKEAARIALEQQAQRRANEVMLDLRTAVSERSRAGAETERSLQDRRTTLKMEAARRAPETASPPPPAPMGCPAISYQACRGVLIPGDVGELWNDAGDAPAARD